MNNFNVGGDSPDSGRISFGNDSVGIELSGGPTPASGLVSMADSVVDVGYMGKAKAGLLAGFEVEVSVDPANGEVELTVGLAAGLKGSATVSYTKAEGLTISKGSIGLGVIAGAYVDTPVGGVGAAAGANIGLSVEDGKTHVGLIADAEAGILTIDGEGEVRLGNSADFGALSDPDGGMNGANMVRSSYGSAIVPMRNDGYGVGIEPGHEYNALDQITGENGPYYTDDTDGLDASGTNGATEVTGTNTSVTTSVDNVTSVAEVDLSTGTLTTTSSITTNSGVETTVTTQDHTGTYSTVTTTNTSGNVESVRNGSYISPVILDLDGDGVEVAFGTQTYFDWDNDGFLVCFLKVNSSCGAGGGVSI